MTFTKASFRNVLAVLLSRLIRLISLNTTDWLQDLVCFSYSAELVQVSHHLYPLVNRTRNSRAPPAVESSGLSLGSICQLSGAQAYWRSQSGRRSNPKHSFSPQRLALLAPPISRQHTVAPCEKACSQETWNVEISKGAVRADCCVCALAGGFQRANLKWTLILFFEFTLSYTRPPYGNCSSSYCLLRLFLPRL
ncbi:uncharacterized protein IWZ02DRAFT_292976 [Phyllosticta citriasiana]|uniref:Uncharacterized protein n=1 Tax=Phyllosticta citriasiana TaxID=595635 RepID=A0ABR1KQ01_9PEZI